MEEYRRFIENKTRKLEPSGFDVEEHELNSNLFPFQRAITRWALKRGRACMFLDTGLGKTICQLEWASKVAKETGKNVLIVAPLAVGQQTIREADKFEITKTSSIGIWDEKSDFDIQVTNYEKIHKVNPDDFVGIVLDESSILKSVSGKQRTQILDTFDQTPYKLACTATPAPNDTMELANHSEFMGVMTRTEILSMFFVHDGGETAKWRLKGHGSDIFWKWVAEWAMMIRKPGDIGFEDDGYCLPELTIHKHIIEQSKPSPGRLFATEARTLEDQRLCRNETVEKRCERIASLVKESGQKWVVWCNLNKEQDTLASMMGDGCVSIQGSTKDDLKVSLEHKWRTNSVPALITKPKIFGFGMNWQHCSNVAFCGLSHSYEQFYQAIRRCWRFGQTKPVNVHIVTAEANLPVLDNICRKEQEAQKMSDGMIDAMSAHSQENITGAVIQDVSYDPQIKMETPSWMKM